MLIQEIAGGARSLGGKKVNRASIVAPNMLYSHYKFVRSSQDMVEIDPEVFFGAGKLVSAFGYCPS